VFRAVTSASVVCPYMLSVSRDCAASVEQWYSTWGTRTPGVRGDILGGT
jgi:hypothetical protein